MAKNSARRASGRFLVRERALRRRLCGHRCARVSKAEAARGIELHFLQPLPLEYVQFGRPFVPWLSIIDVLMFNELDTVRAWLDSHYELT